MKKLTKISTALLIAGLGFSFAASSKVTVFAFNDRCFTTSSKRLRKNKI